MPTDLDHLRAVYLEVIDLDEPERTRALEETCGDDAELRAGIERLLAATAGGAADTLALRAPDGRLDTPDAFDHEADLDPSDTRLDEATRPEPPGIGARPPERIGSYRLHEAIGEGGMATVYLATQDHPRRSVAVKLMKPGVASRSALRRFEFESQVLGRLRHPNIAQVFEAGTYDDGTSCLPYFAMEYIPGAKTLIEYAKAQRLVPRERVRLFVRICDAVQHGHQRGIIHRDLKPSNVLVDASGEPRVIDFGVARATDSDMAVTTLQTDVGQLVGTLQFMSPEQCEASPMGLDTRSDVYSLGVMLYELLCERLPYDLTARPIHEAVRIIREETPARPSMLNRALRGDLETIALKALAKERGRRYRSAGELGEDLERYLDCEPILARPPSVVYHARMFARRNRAYVYAAVFGLLVLGLAAVGDTRALVPALGLGLGGTTLGFLRAARAGTALVRQRDDAVRARREAETERRSAMAAETDATEQRAAAEQARHAAELEAAKARAISTFLVRGMLKSADPARTRGGDLTVAQVLDNASERVEEAFAEQPAVEVEVRETIGAVYRSLGRLTEAEPHLRAALDLRRHLHEEPSLEVAACLRGLARLQYERGDHAAAEPTYREALGMREALLGPDHPLVGAIMSELASLLRERGELDEAESLCSAALEINLKHYGHGHAAVATSQNKLAKLLEARGDLDRAEPLLHAALESQRTVLGDDHLHVAFTLNNLANLLQRRQEHDAAERCLREALTIFRARLGPRHQHVVVALNNLARSLQARGQAEEAARSYREVLDLIARTRAEGPWSEGRIRARYGETLATLGRHADAADQLRAAYEELEDELGPGHDRVRRVARGLVEVLTASGRPEEAARWRAETA